MKIMFNQALSDISSGEQYVVIDAEGNHIDTLWQITGKARNPRPDGVPEGCRVYKVTVDEVL